MKQESRHSGPSAGNIFVHGFQRLMALFGVPPSPPAETELEHMTGEFHEEDIKRQLSGPSPEKADEIVEEASDESFPASDPPAWTKTTT